MYKAEIKIPQIRLKNSKEIWGSIQANDQLHKFELPLREPLLISILDSNTPLDIIVQESSEQLRWKIDLESELGGAQSFDKWFRLKEIKSASHTPTVSLSLTSEFSATYVMAEQKKILGAIRVVFSLDESKPQQESPKAAQKQCQNCKTLETFLRAQQSDLYAAEDRLQLESKLTESLQGTKFEVNHEFVEITKWDSREFTVQFPSLKEITENDIRHLKIALLNANEKIKSFDTMQKEIEKLRQELESSNSIRELLEKSMEEAALDFEVSLEKQNKNHEEQIEDILNENIELKGIRKKWESLEEKVKRDSSCMKLLQQQMTNLQADNLILTDLKSQLTTIRSGYVQLEEQRDQLLEMHQTATSSFQNQMSELIAKLDSTNKVNTRYRDEVAKLTTRLADCTGQIEAKEQLCIELKAKVSHLQATALTKQIKSNSDQINDEIECGRQKLQLALESSTQDFKHQIEILTDQNETLMEENTVFIVSNGETMETLDQLKADLDQSLQANFTLSKKIQSMEQIHTALQDKLDRVNQTTMLQEFDTNTNHQLMQQTAMLSDYVLKQSDKLLTSNTIIDKVSQQLDEKNQQIFMLKKKVENLKPKNYQPDVDDTIDLALAEFINSREQIPVQFTRESEGVYSFGSRRVFMKMEQGRLIVNVGGGYLRPEQFMENYAQVEIQKQKSQSLKRHMPSYKLSLPERLRSVDSNFSGGTPKSGLSITPKASTSTRGGFSVTPKAKGNTGRGNTDGRFIRTVEKLTKPSNATERKPRSVSKSFY